MLRTGRVLFCKVTERKRRKLKAVPAGERGSAPGSRFAEKRGIGQLCYADPQTCVMRAEWKAGMQAFK